MITAQGRVFPNKHYVKVELYDISTGLYTEIVDNY